MPAIALLVRRHLDAIACEPLRPQQHAIRRWVPSTDGPTVAALAGALSDARDGPRPRADGLAAALVGRTGRDVDAWLAWSAGVERECRGDRADGLVSLVRALVQGGGQRWSIGWLLVRPEARRQGLGRSLVETAVHHARAAGATEIWAETSAAWSAMAFWRAMGFDPAITRA